MRSKSLPAVTAGRSSASVIGQWCLPSSDSGGGESEESNSAAAAKKAGARGEALCLTQSGKRDAALGHCPNTKQPELSLSAFFLSLCYSFLSLPLASLPLPHTPLTCLINISAYHLHSHYGRGPAAASGVSAHYPDCSAVSENSRCYSRISSLQGRKANGPQSVPVPPLTVLI